jgi:hypothetical protein
MKYCLHVTSADAIESIMAHGLEPRIGPLSKQVETKDGIFMFLSWNDMEDANWLFDEAWPQESEPALLAINTEGLALEVEAGFEVVFRRKIDLCRITMLAPTQVAWDVAKHRFIALGGQIQSNYFGVQQIEPEDTNEESVDSTVI